MKLSTALAIVALFVAVFVLLDGSHPAEAGRYTARRFCSPLIFDQNGKPWGSEERCQDQFNEWAMEAGHGGVGLMDRILGLDMPLDDKQVYRVIVRAKSGRPDTLWFAPILQKHWSPGERTYVCVVRGVEVPDSVRVVLADGSSFVQPVERKRK